MAYTLTELLVSVCIIAIIAALLLPAIQRGIGIAQTTKCASNLRQIFQMEMSFAAENNNRIGAAAPPPDPTTGSAPNPFMTWSDWLIGSNNQPTYFPGSHPIKGVTRSDFNVLMCPSQRLVYPSAFKTYANYSPGSGTIYRTYGMIHVPGAVTVSGYLMTEWVHDGWHYLGSVPSPATIPLMADTVSYTGSTYPLQFYYFYPHRLSENSGIHLRHNGKANVLFYDGHVSALSRQDLADMNIKQAISSDYKVLDLH